MDAFTAFIVCFVVTFALVQIVFYFLNKRADKKLAQLRAELEAANRKRDQAIMDAADAADQQLCTDIGASNFPAPTRLAPPRPRRTGTLPEMSAPYGRPAASSSPRQETTPDDTTAILMAAAAASYTPPVESAAPSYHGGGGTFDGAGASGDWGSSSSSSSSDSSSSSYSSSDSSSSSSSSDSGSSSCGSD